LGYVKKLSCDPKGLASPPEGRIGCGSRRIVDLGRSSVCYNASLGLLRGLGLRSRRPIETSRVSSLVYWNLFFPRTHLWNSGRQEVWIRRSFCSQEFAACGTCKPRGRDFLSPLNNYHDIQVTANPVRETTDCSAHTSRRTVGF
jgi:hypothetical protein